MKQTLTTKSIDALKPVEAKRYEVRDIRTPGLHLRVSSTGAKVFCLSIRVDGQRRRIRIGPYPIISLADARRRASEISRDIELGMFENEKAQLEATTATLGETISQFIDRYAKPNTKDWQGTRSILSKFASLSDIPIDQIKRKDVVSVIDSIVGSGTPTRANRALAAIKKLMNWCIDRGMIETSPVAHLKPPTKETARERVLSDAELKTCWHMAEIEGFPFAQCVQLMILTGQRRGEVSGMRWSELDLDNSLWSLPSARVKNSTAHIVPLAPLAVDILKSVPRFQNSDLVFTTTGTTSISGFGRLKERLDSGLPNAEDWRFHDMRRTMATNMAMLRVAPHIIEAVLNHKSGIVSGVAAIYNRHAYLDEKREALKLWSDRVQQLTNNGGTIVAENRHRNLHRGEGSVSDSGTGNPRYQLAG